MLPFSRGRPSPADERSASNGRLLACHSDVKLNPEGETKVGGIGTRPPSPPAP